jgi:hypothetical protein
MKQRLTTLGSAPAQLPVPTTGAAARDHTVDGPRAQPGPPGEPSHRLPPSQPHLSLIALARLLARQIGRSGGENA